MTEMKHIGRNISLIRELRDMKQETLAEGLGVSQQSVSKFEQNENINDLMLGRIAKVLRVSPEVIKNFNGEEAIFNFQNNYENASDNNIHQANINPVEKWMDALAKNEKLASDIKELYERFLQSEKDKADLLQTMVDKLVVLHRPGEGKAIWKRG